MEIYRGVAAIVADVFAAETQKGTHVTSQPDPEMTPEEREQFERNELHHDDENPSSGPASEPDVRRDTPQPPDTGAIKR